MLMGQALQSAENPWAITSIKEQSSAGTIRNRPATRKELIEVEVEDISNIERELTKVI